MHLTLSCSIFFCMQKQKQREYDPRSQLVDVLNAIVEKRVNHSIDGLMKEDRVREKIQTNPALRTVLRLGLEKGIIPEQQGVESALKQVEVAIKSAEVTDTLLEERPTGKPGRPPKEAREIQEKLLNSATQQGEYAKLLSDNTYETYLKKMSLTLHRLQITPEQLDETQFTQALLSHMTAEYQLMKEINVPPSVIKQYGHVWSVYHADQIQQDSRRVFGGDEESLPLIRTAAFQLFTKQYPSVEAAKQAYDKKLKEAKQRIRKSQLRELILPNIDGMNTSSVVEAFKPIVERIGSNFEASNMGQEDAQQTAYLTIMQTLQDGETDPTKIVDKIIQKVTKEAAKQAAFTRLTIELPDYW